MSDPTFDFGEGQRRAREGAERATEHATFEWKDKAWGAATHVAHLNATFTTDDIWQCLDDAGVPRPHEARAMSGITSRLIRERKAVRLNVWEESARPEAHANPKRKYRSLVCR